MANIKGNKIANYFHSDAGTMCQGCHHASPETRKPPKCSSCHGKPFDANNPLRPGLMAAYHQQCMECHRAMGLKKPQATDCTGCHKKK
jgi:DnaJ-class molecular chaperone